MHRDNEKGKDKDSIHIMKCHSLLCVDFMTCRFYKIKIKMSPKLKDASAFSRYIVAFKKKK